jgi:hypothetical protein
MGVEGSRIPTSEHSTGTRPQAFLHVVYRADSFHNDGTPIATLVESVKRARGGEYSRELATKVFLG